MSGLREETRQQISGLREETLQGFQRIDDTTRQTLVLVEGLQGEVRLIAEGFVGLNEKLDRVHAEATLVFDEVKGWIEPYYRNLDGRVRVLEGRADRQQGDVLDAVRTMLGRPPLASPVIE
jgi:hypothetical protein